MLAGAISGEADSVTALVAVDVDGDGDLDVFQLNAHGPGRLLRNSGNGFFSHADEQELPLETEAAAVATVADLDGDGAVDLLVGRHGAQPLWLRNAAGTLSGRAVGNADDVRVHGCGGSGGHRWRWLARQGVLRP